MVFGLGLLRTNDQGLAEFQRMAEEDTSCKEGFLNPSSPPASAPYEEPPPPYPGDTPYLTKQIQHPPHESEPMLPTSAILQASPLEFHPGEYPPSGVQYIPQPNAVVVTTSPPLGAVLNESSEAEVNTYLCCSIFNFLCCCPFIGLVAVYLSGKECCKKCNFVVLILVSPKCFEEQTTT